MKLSNVKLSLFKTLGKNYLNIEFKISALWKMYVIMICYFLFSLRVQLVCADWFILVAKNFVSLIQYKNLYFPGFTVNVQSVKRNKSKTHLLIPNCHRGIKLVPINMDYYLLQIDALKFVLMVLHGGVNTQL